jgi:hypothetical protein
MVSINWDSVTNGSHSIDWDEVTKPPSFASGTLKGMKEYEGLSPEQATQKYLSGWGKTLDVIGEKIADPIGTAKDIASATAHDVAHPVETAERLGRWAYENPDEAFMQGLAMGAPGLGELGAATRLQRVGREVAGAEAPKVALGGAPELTTGAVGAKMNEMRKTGGSFPRSGFAPVMKDIREDLKNYKYDAPTHKNVAIALGHIDRLLTGDVRSPEGAMGMLRVGGTDVPVDHPLAAKVRAAERLKAMGGTYDFGDIENALENIRPTFKASGKQPAMGQMIEEKIENHVYSLPGGPEFMQYRSQYSQAKKLDTINQIKERADIVAGRRFTTAGLGHALAQEVDKIAKNPRELRRWTPAEQDVIKSIAGRKGLDERMARAVGKLSVRGPMNIGLDYLVHLALGPLIPGGTMGVMLAGEAGRQWERRIAAGKIREWENLTSAGGDVKNLGKVVGDPVVGALNSSPSGRRALHSWQARASRATTRALALEIARATNKPQLIPRIEQEINQIEPVSDQ